MSFNCRRNIFSLGSLRKSKRWQPADLFESDPFKIHSYNFRYAERPALQLPVLRNRRVDNNEIPNDCQTFFYNQDFSNNSNLNPASSANDRRLMNLARFQEYRRRRFLNQARSQRSYNITGISSNCNSYQSQVLNSYNDQGNINKRSSSPIKEDMSNILCSNNTTKNNSASKACGKNYMKSSISKTLSVSQSFQNDHHVAAPCSSAAICEKNTRILGSGCEININIKGLENNSLKENVNINIDTDSACRIMPSVTKVMKHSNLTTPTDRVEHLQSSNTNSFIINKRLAKFDSTWPTQSDLRERGKERAKELTSIYSSQMLNINQRAGPAISSRDPITSLATFKPNTTAASSSSFMSGKLTGKKSFIQKVRDNLSVYDTKPLKKFNSRNNLNRSSYKLAYRESKVSKKPQRAGSKSALCGSARLPLNININFFADKLKE